MKVRFSEWTMVRAFSDWRAFTLTLISTLLGFSLYYVIMMMAVIGTGHGYSLFTSAMISCYPVAYGAVIVYDIVLLSSVPSHFSWPRWYRPSAEAVIRWTAVTAHGLLITRLFFKDTFATFVVALVSFLAWLIIPMVWRARKA